jgi:hypothetical protein
LEAKDGGKQDRGKRTKRKIERGGGGGGGGEPAETSGSGWRILYVLQIFVGAAKQSGIDAIRDGGERECGGEGEEELETGYRNRKRVKKGRRKV